MKWILAMILIGFIILSFPVKEKQPLTGMAKIDSLNKQYTVDSLRIIQETERKIKELK